jgi:hypothetical protein
VIVNFKPLAFILVSLTAFASVTAWSPSAAAAGGQSPAADSKERARLEELFIWKTSEELKLQPSDELKFTDVVHDLNKRRREANARMEDALGALASAKTRAESEKALAAHRAALRETQAVQTAELDRLRPLLGSEKLAKYIVAKSEILEKLKTMLAAPNAMPSSSGSSMSTGTVSASTTPATGAAGTHASPAAKAK